MDGYWAGCVSEDRSVRVQMIISKAGTNSRFRELYIGRQVQLSFVVIHVSSVEKLCATFTDRNVLCILKCRIELCSSRQIATNVRCGPCCFVCLDGCVACSCDQRRIGSHIRLEPALI